MSPAPEHEKTKVVLSDLVAILLDELDMPWESLGSSTLRREDMAVGIEPDDCFYNQHYADILGKERLDVAVALPSGSGAGGGCHVHHGTASVCRLTGA